ncbi:MAG: DUF393 domain-containing protein [Crocinitomicaceae bacterium]|nr:DUF393 domain-containing protein [Crocinitomicaceae bacterium]
MDKKNVPVVLYDGDCGFCNRSVAFVMKQDKTKTIYFAALQSNFTKELFIQNDWEEPDLSTFYFIEKGELFQKSKAALKVAKYFSFPFNLIQSFIIVPRFISDGVYDFIAKRRQKLSSGFCLMPTEEERKRFIR